MEMTVELATSILDWALTAIISVAIAWCATKYPAVVGAGIVTVGTAYAAKLARYRMDRWKRPVVLDPESGRTPHYEVILRKNAHSIIATPFSHVFRPWFITIGWVDPNTGSVSITDHTIYEVKYFDKNRHNFGTCELVSSQAFSHLLAKKSEILAKEDQLSQEEQDILDTIASVLKHGLSTKRKQAHHSQL